LVFDILAFVAVKFPLVYFSNPFVKVFVTVSNIIHLIQLTIKQELHIKVQSEEDLYLDYPASHPEVIYDICDMNGRICLTGFLERRNDHRIDIAALREGDYLFFLIDEGNILKQRIKV
jgi:hypothetical protein